MAEQLSVNRKTVQLVYEELVAQGWLETRARSGTFVSHDLPERSPTSTALTTVTTDRVSLPSTQLLEAVYRQSLSGEAGLNIANDGTPDPRLIPYELLGRTYRRACLRAGRKSYLDYGDPQGTQELRQAVEKMLCADRYMSRSADEICIVRGSQMGIFLAARILDPNEGAIVMGDLSYPPARAAFESNNFQIIECKIDARGMNIEHLRMILDTQSIAAVYVTPHHQYPTTVSLPMDRRLEMLHLSKAHGFAILEDDYDHEFHYGAEPIPPLASLPDAENVVHIGSMSKVFAPGMRLGYVAADRNLIMRMVQEIVIIDRQGNPLPELVLSELMDSGDVKRHIRKVRRIYRERRDHAVKEFERLFGSRIKIETPTGGLALWIDLSALLTDQEQTDINLPDMAYNTQFMSGSTIKTHIRFGYGALNTTDITRRIQKLYDIIS